MSLRAPKNIAHRKYEAEMIVGGIKSCKERNIHEPMSYIIFLVRYINGFQSIENANVPFSFKLVLMPIFKIFCFKIYFFFKNNFCLIC